MSKRSRFSYSSLTSYEACPASWRQTFLNDDPGLVPQNVRDGAMTHEGIQRYAKVCWPKRSYDCEAGFAIADSYPEPVRGLLTKFVDEFRWEWGTVIGSGTACPVEWELTAKLPSGRTFSGHVDLLRCFEGAATERAYFGEDDTGSSNNLWIVTDFKNRSYNAEEVKVTEENVIPLQLLVYAWLVQANHPEARHFELRYYLLAGYEVGPWEISGDLSWVAALLDERCERMDRDTEWEPHMGAACFTCFHRLTCPLHDKATWERCADNSPEGMLKQLCWYKAQADQLDDLLKRVAGENGPVRIPGWKYEGRQSGSLELREGIDLAEFGLREIDLRGGWNKAKITAAARKLGKANEDNLIDQEAAFWGCWERKPGTISYRAYKDNGDDEE